MAYSTAADLMFGSVPPPSDLDRWIEAADEEIDSAIGRLYVTPITFPTSTEARPAKLLLKRVSAMLATGRAIMAIDAGSQENSLHQYASYLVREATQALKDIADGEILLDGIQMVNPDSTTSGPSIYNLDEVSAVEEFYKNFQPGSMFPESAPRRWWG